MSNSNALHSSGTEDHESLLAAYSELCTSYNAIREFRARLLGFLPLASAGGVFLLLNAEETNIGPLTLVAIGLFGCLITVGLYTYERHNMERCHKLIRLGAEWEETGLKLKNGQFLMRLERDGDEIAGGSGFKLAASLIYGAVFLGWLYVAIVGSLKTIAHEGSWLALF